MSEHAGTVHNMYTTILFPGRHHLLTRFQADYLHQLVNGDITRDVNGDNITVDENAVLVFAVTSATHHGTRRNPIPANRREAAIEQFAAVEQLDTRVYPVADIAPCEQFAAITVNHINVAAGNDNYLHPDHTLVACSTPELIVAYQDLGYQVAGVEADRTPAAVRPGEVLEQCGRGDSNWKQHAHPASIDVFDRYNLDEHCRNIWADPVATADGSLTTTRNYRTYTDAFDNGSDRKWDLVRNHVRPGRVVDIGCAAGGLLERAAADPRLVDSDLYGIDISRHLLAEAEHRKAQGAFSNPNTFFVNHNMLNGAVFADRSVDTTITVALTHEIHSYTPGGTDTRNRAVDDFIEVIYNHTRGGGVWVNTDVCGPQHPHHDIILELRDTDGVNDWSDMTPRTTAHVSALSTAARFELFAADFTANAGVSYPYQQTDSRSGVRRYQLSLRDAMEYMTRKDYVDNWISETHETFCHWTWDDWVRHLEAAGFELEAGSGPWRNNWIVEQRFAACATLTDLDGHPLDWPVTHMTFIATRPQLSAANR